MGWRETVEGVYIYYFYHHKWSVNNPISLKRKRVNPFIDYISFVRCLQIT